MVWFSYIRHCKPNATHRYICIFPIFPSPPSWSPQSHSGSLVTQDPSNRPTLCIDRCDHSLAGTKCLNIIALFHSQRKRKKCYVRYK